MKMDKLKDFAAKKYSLQAENITQLESYGSENYKVESKSGNFVLKFYDPSQEPYIGELLEAENLLQLKLKSESRGVFPVPQKDSEGKYRRNYKQL